VMAGVLKQIIGNDSALVLLPERNPNVEAGIRNLDNVYSLLTPYMNVRDLLSYDRVIIPVASLEVIQSILGKKARITE